MDNNIRRMSAKQQKEAYAQYLRAKERKVAGTAYDFDTWRNEMETYLNRHASRYGKGFTNEQVKEANRKITAAGDYTGKQKAALRKSYQRYKDAISEGINPAEGDSEELTFWQDLEDKYPELAKEGLGGNWALISGFLTAYSGNWNEYFNS